MDLSWLIFHNILKPPTNINPNKSLFMTDFHGSKNVVALFMCNFLKILLREYTSNFFNKTTCEEEQK